MVPAGAFSTTFDTGALGVAGSPYTIRYSYAGDGTYASTSTTGTLTVSRARPTVNVADAGGTFTGKAFPGTATVTGVGGITSSSLESVAPTLTYYAGSSATGSPLAGAPSQAGTYTVVAGFAGSVDYAPSTAAPASFTVARAATQVVMIPLPRFKRKKLVSLGLEAEVGPISPGSGVPTGTVTFEVQVKSKKKAEEKVLGIATLRGGSATLTLNPSKVLNKPVKIVFGGDADFASNTGPTTTLTQKRLTTLARTIQL